MKEMKEFKGTSGEWKIQEPYNTFVYGSDGKLICQMKYDPFSEESAANARLISASPELLEALQETDKDLCILEGSMAQIEKVDKRAEGMTGLVKEWRARNKKAINKALGL